MKKYRVGYTTGVFDLLHVGHLNILRQAKEQCEYLIVGVSTDKLVEQYKYKKAIIPFEERIELIAAIRYVDEVVPQVNMDKMEAWERLQFDAMFHGDDWKDSVLYQSYAQQFQQVGVDIVFIPYTKGISSTQIAEILKDLK